MPPWAARRARMRGGTLKNVLCLVTDCDKSNPLPERRPGGPYAHFGPYETTLVELDASRTIMYGFSGALVACPVARGTRAMPLPGDPAAFKTSHHGKGATVPGLSWSYGGEGDCAGVEGIASAVDGFGPEWYGELPDYGYWLPELLEHFASWGVVTACPFLRGVPDGAAGATATVNAARMLVDLQPCGPGVVVDAGKLGVAGCSLGAGRAVRGAASAPDAIAAVVALHTWELAQNNYDASVKAPLMLLSGTDDTNAPFANTLRTYRAARGPKIVGALRGEPLHVAEILGRADYGVFVDASGGGREGGEVRVGGRGFGVRERYHHVATEGLRLVEEQGGRRVQVVRMNTADE